ncbi:MAG: nucleotide sugar dehydrogenase [Chloroflexota bacterium]|nr:nucleotide sugar dehydrogenase [Chloroflexota bacterium]
MRVCVSGLWHLGTVTAACLAEAGHEVVGHDPDLDRVQQLAAGIPPFQEPGLQRLLNEGIAGGRLIFTTDARSAVPNSRVLWVTHDTPVGAFDRADSASVITAVSALFEHVTDGTLVLLSSQLPAGTTALLANSFRSKLPDRTAHFAYSPENLRLGTSIDSFKLAERVVIGLKDAGARTEVEELLEPLGLPIRWMSVESAEMTKHALNSFLAASIVFANEVAAVCEAVGADIADVTRALHEDPRIGAHAYLTPGAGYAGGTLGRDVAYLGDLLVDRSIQAPLLSSIAPSNAHQQTWVQRALVSRLGELAGKRIAVWGLTYKPSTDTLRRSASMDLCEWLLARQAHPVAHDPAIRELPAAVESRIPLYSDPLDAARDADALVVMTSWPEFRSVDPAVLVERMRNPIIIDPQRHLESLAEQDSVRYAAVGWTAS